jgi:hypothetical protein
MSKVIELDIPTPTQAAAKRVIHLMETGYLPQQFKTDLQTLLDGAMAWEFMTRKTVENR